MAHLTVPDDIGQRIYVATAAQTVFSVPFPFAAAAELSIYVNGEAQNPSGFSVVGSAVDGGYQSGTVTFTVGRTAGDLVAIVRDTSIERATDFPYPSQTLDIRAVNTEFDRTTMRQQENKRALDGVLRVRAAEAGIAALPAKADRANHVLAFDAAGDPMASAPSAENLPVTDYTVGFLQAADAAAARETLGLGLALTLVYPGFLMGSLRPFTPSGWLACYGQAVSRTTYAVLWAALGSPNSGDGSTTFNLPDLRGRSLFGKDDMGGTPANRITNAVSGITGTTLAAAGGDQRLQQHSHGVTDPSHTHNYATLGGPGVGAGANGWLVGVGGEAQPTQPATTGITIQNAGDGGAQNMPPAMIVNWLIYTGVAA